MLGHVTCERQHGLGTRRKEGKGRVQVVRLAPLRCFNLNVKPETFSGLGPGSGFSASQPLDSPLVPEHRPILVSPLTPPKFTDLRNSARTWQCHKNYWCATVLAHSGLTLLLDTYEAVTDFSKCCVNVGSDPNWRPLTLARVHDRRPLWSDVAGRTNTTHDSTAGFRDQVIAFKPETESLAAVQSSARRPVGHPDTHIDHPRQLHVKFNVLSQFAKNLQVGQLKVLAFCVPIQFRPNHLVEVLLNTLKFFLRPLWKQVGGFKKRQKRRVSMPFRTSDVDGPFILAISGTLPT